MNTGQQATPRIALSQEEMKVLLQCNKDAFWQRSLPLMAIMGGAAHALVTMGYLKPHPARGSLFKVMAAGAAGWLVGKASFRSECQNRILEQLPNSRLAEQVRAQRAGIQSPYDIRPPQPGGPVVIPPQSPEDDETKSTGEEVPGEDGVSRESEDTERSTRVSYDELRRKHHKQTFDNFQQQQQQLQEEDSGKPPTYEVLRKQHHQQTAFQNFQQQEQQQQQQQSAASSAQSSAPRHGQRVNKYGDIIEE